MQGFMANDASRKELEAGRKLKKPIRAKAQPYEDILFGSSAFNNLFAIVGNFRCNNWEFCLQFRPISFCNNHRCRLT